MGNSNTDVTTYAKGQNLNKRFHCKGHSIMRACVVLDTEIQEIKLDSITIFFPFKDDRRQSFWTVRKISIRLKGFAFLQHTHSPIWGVQLLFRVELVFLCLYSKLWRNGEAGCLMKKDNVLRWRIRDDSWDCHRRSYLEILLAAQTYKGTIK